MTLEAGTRLGPYEIVAPIGAGGMALRGSLHSLSSHPQLEICAPFAPSGQETLP